MNGKYSKIEITVIIAIMALLVSILAGIVKFSYANGVLDTKVNNNIEKIDTIENKIDVVSERTYTINSKVDRALIILETAERHIKGSGIKQCSIREGYYGKKE